MIIDAGIDNKQRAIIQRICQAQIESLVRLLTDSALGHSYLIEQGYDLTEDQLIDMLTLRIERFSDLQDKPETFLMLPDSDLALLEYTMVNDIETHEGDENTSGIWLKILRLGEYSKHVGAN